MSDTTTPKYTKQEDILDIGFRKLVISEMVNGTENLNRKAVALRKHEIFRDKNSKWVMAAIEKEGYRQITIEQMRNRVSNISICRKIIEKLAQTYVGGVERKVGDEIELTDNKGLKKKVSGPDQVSLDALEDTLDVDTAFKKVDAYRQLFKNTTLQVVPKLCSEETEEAGSDKYDIQLKALAPWEYDVIEDPNNAEEAAVYILTDFPERNRYIGNLTSDEQGFRTAVTVPDREGDGKDQIIADSPADKGANTKDRTFIWWTNKYHFTTDLTGTIIKDKSPADNLNPIGTKPFIDVCVNQDGFYWATGGDDVVEASILINKKMTDVNFISFVQGWGQLVVAAKDVPKKLVGGPDNAFIFNLQPGDPTPIVQFASSNPPIKDWLETIKMTLALVLTTNNLSSRSLSADLDVKSVASGIALLIENSEVITSIQDVQVLFQDKEPEFWELLSKWHTLYAETNSLVEELQEIAPMKQTDVSLKFTQVRPPMSETEKLQDLTLRKQLGINTMVDLIKKDNPDLSDEEAQAKAEEVIADKVKQAQLMIKLMPATPGGTNPDGTPTPPGTEQKPEPGTNLPRQQDNFGSKL